jgi:hypothetical protein
MEEKTKKIIQDFKPYIINFLKERERRIRIDFNKSMYEIFTPFYIQIWHKLKGIKPYENQNYKPKF